MQIDEWRKHLAYQEVQGPQIETIIIITNLIYISYYVSSQNTSLFPFYSTQSTLHLHYDSHSN